MRDPDQVVAVACEPAPDAGSHRVRISPIVNTETAAS
jgi:hypothetical protein